MKGGEASRDAAGIRLHIEAVSDSPNGDRETVRDEDESHVRKESVIDPLAVGRFVDGTSGLIRGYGLADSRRPSCIIMLRRNGLPTRGKARRRRSWSDFHVFPRKRDRSPESVYRLCLDRRRLRGSPSLVGRWIANPVRSAPGGSNPPPRADARGSDIKCSR